MQEDAKMEYKEFSIWVSTEPSFKRYIILINILRLKTCLAYVTEW